MRREKCLAIASLVIGLHASITLGQPSPAPPAPGDYHETLVRQSDDPAVLEATYRLWVPKGCDVVRCVLAINQRAAGQRVFFGDPKWRQMAARQNAAMMFCGFEAHDAVASGGGPSMLRALEQFARRTGHAELSTAPMVLWGHSMGGRVAQDFTRWKPERVIAFIMALRANPSDADFMRESQEAMRVPGLYLMGGDDRKPADIREHFHRSRAVGAPRAWVWLPGQSHWPRGMSFERDETSDRDWRAWSASELVIPWTEAIIAQRLPVETSTQEGDVDLADIDLARGWLSEVDAPRIMPFGEFQGDKSRASWFPTQMVAERWLVYLESVR